MSGEAEIRGITRKIESGRSRLGRLQEDRIDAVVAAMSAGMSMGACALAAGMARQSLRQQIRERRPVFYAELRGDSLRD
jgi:hypothetical protein